jgi:signal peptidase I
MGFFLFLLIGYLLVSVSLYFLFPKAGVPGWKGLVPGYNYVIWAQLVGRKPTHALFMLFPIVNIFIHAGLCIDMVRSFRHYTFWASVLAVLFTPFYFLYLAFTPKEQYDGPTLLREREYRERLKAAQDAKNTRQLNKLQAENPYKKGPLREWAEAIIFAVFAAAFIRMFLIEAYVIPTSSMEDSLLVGDFLFVSKAHYGIRTPQTIAMVPLLHNRIPGLNTESYLEKPKLDYYRLPALETIDRNDLIVFNYPEGDSVYVFPERTWSIYDFRRGSIPTAYAAMIQSGRNKLVTRPMDKMDHYIKRCVAVGGDSVEIRNRQLYINGKSAQNPSKLEFAYQVVFPDNNINTRNFADWGISAEDRFRDGEGNNIFILTEEQKRKIQGMDARILVSAYEMGKRYDRPGRVFPNDAAHFPAWNVDNYGPIWIPKKGTTIQIDTANIALYQRVIDVYEENELKIENGRIFINGRETNQYTFRQNYYWAMGDNRHNSEDSRIWGYVPERNMVGKPLFIWFSLKEGKLSNGINWNRIFSSAAKK